MSLILIPPFGISHSQQPKLSKIRTSYMQLLRCSQRVSVLQTPEGSVPPKYVFTLLLRPVTSRRCSDGSVLVRIVCAAQFVDVSETHSEGSAAAAIVMYWSVVVCGVLRFTWCTC